MNLLDTLPFDYILTQKRDGLTYLCVQWEISPEISVVSYQGVEYVVVCRTGPSYAVPGASDCVRRDQLSQYQRHRENEKYMIGQAQLKDLGVEYVVVKGTKQSRLAFDSDHVFDTREIEALDRFSKRVNFACS